MKPKLLRITTVPLSLHKLLQGQVNFMQENGFELVLASADGKEIEAIEKETGLVVHILPLTRKINLLKDLRALWTTYKLIKKQKPDFVHTHTPKAGIVGMLAGKLAHVPIRLHTVAGLPLLEVTGAKRKLLNFVEKLTYASATKVYPNSYGLLQIILDNKFTRLCKLAVIANGSSNGIDTNYFSPASVSKATSEKLQTKLGITADEIVFSFIGRLVGDKGINELVAAFKQLQLKHKNTKLIVVGDEEPTLDPLQTATIQAIKTHNNIITTGWVNDVRPYLAISDVFVFPSYREGMPNVVLQAGAMSLPCIVTDINGSNEIIIADENGLIIPVKNTTALLDSMQQILNPRLREKLRGTTRELIVNRFEQKVVWEALRNEYKELLGNKG